MCNRQRINVERMRNLLQNNQIFFLPVILTEVKKINNILFW